MNPRGLHLDELNRTLVVGGVGLLLLGYVFGTLEAMRIPVIVFRALGAALLMTAIYRQVGRSPEKRAFTNLRYLTFVTEIKEYLHRPVNLARQESKSFKRKVDQQRSYRLLLCPQCSQTLRVPRGKGKILVTCTRCKNKFMAKS